jgi:hypothetical protein
MPDTDPRSIPAAAAQPPIVQSLIASGIGRFSALVGATMRRINGPWLYALWFGGGVALAIFVLIGSIVQSPGLAGAAQGLFAGLFLGLLYLAGFGFLYISYRHENKKAAPGPVGVDIDRQLAPILRELDVLRADVSERVRTRSLVRIPIGVIGGIALWFASQRADDPPGALGFLLFMLVGAIAGERWAAHSLERQYRRRYKDEVLPRLARGIGDLTYRAARPERLNQFGAPRILPAYDHIDVDDEIAGTHRGLPIEIIEVRLKRRVNKKTRVVFDGLVVGITLPRRLTSTTLIATDRGAWENFKARWSGSNMETVRLEHPEFEQRYEVYSTDQIEARSLLTPAFMERFVKLGTTSQLGVPGAIADGNHLAVALPKRLGMGNLFEPPPYWKAAGGESLAGLQADIRRVLDVADAIIELDFWARGRANDARAVRPYTE